jgi:hypothetical protein
MFPRDDVDSQRVRVRREACRVSALSRPMDQDPIRKALAPYLSDLLFLREDAAGVLVKPVRNLRDSDDESFLYWYKTNDAIRKLGGTWVARRDPR